MSHLFFFRGRGGGLKQEKGNAYLDTQKDFDRSNFDKNGMKKVLICRFQLSKGIYLTVNYKCMEIPPSTTVKVHIS